MNIINGQELANINSFEIFFVVLTFVLLAEMGDKTQLLVMAFATRYKLRKVIIVVTLSIIGLNAIAVLMGSLITRIIPIYYTQVLASILFIIFGILAFKKEKEKEEKDKVIKINPTLTVATSFFIAELGDKTQLATMALAAKYQAPFVVFLAAVTAMIIADMIGLIAGVALNKYIPKKYIRVFAGFLFIGFGVLGLTSLLSTEQMAAIINAISIVLGVGVLIVIYLLFLRTKRGYK